MPQKTRTPERTYGSLFKWAIFDDHFAVFLYVIAFDLTHAKNIVQATYKDYQLFPQIAQALLEYEPQVLRKDFLGQPLCWLDEVLIEDRPVVVAVTQGDPKTPKL